ncbi:PREDICTED: uncharacterized protein LOC109585181 [Amphimedon queenslandica]|uniref:PH domain-containing protein n=1 Tax=Amphimedon queenslandica TaxID=400682 RepID=A0AAN0JIC6_AMPQE|nr:PREDICTED: uncharacterized protein LOC109585181 [Amphimedon queenslandica]|eukprot:XP_019856724.1 PREDICTED: uncharacterized protein LOC109585181 [Amphimedon queenslandica]
MSSGGAIGSEYVPNGLRRSLRKKYAVKSTRVQPLLNGMTQRPAILKEGFLHKPSFFRFGGKKKRWCVLRTYSSVEASMDIFLDESKTRYKGSICLDKEAQPLIVVKPADDRSSYYMILKVGKNSYHFTTDSQRELKDWAALLRQIVDPAATLFSASIVEPNDLEEGMVNVQFAANYIALLCPLREISLKRWRLEHIASFGQCGGMLTFECCRRCSDPNTSRCSLNIKQEKPATILSLMEKTIRDNPNTNEIHYERSILGDIYHCSHQCNSSPRLLPAFSESNLTQLSTHSSPFASRRRHDLEVSLPPPDIDHNTSYYHNLLENHDSGLGTPQQEDSPDFSGFPSSPITLKPSGKPTSPARKPIKYTSPAHRSRSNSDNKYSTAASSSRYSSTPTRSETDESSGSELGQVSSSLSSCQAKETKRSLQTHRSVSPVKTAARSMTPSTYNKLETVSEPSDRTEPPPLPPTRRESRGRGNNGSVSPPNTVTRSISPSGKKYKSLVPIGVPPPPPKFIKKINGESRLEQVRDSSSDRDHPIADLSSPETRLRSGTHIVQRELPPHLPRERAQSQSDFLEVSSPSHRVHTTGHGGVHGRFRAVSKSTSDELGESYDALDNLKSINPFFRLDELEYDEREGEQSQEVMSNLADYRHHKNGYCEPGLVDKVLSKVACDNVPCKISGKPNQPMS